MNIDDLTIGEARKLASMFGGSPSGAKPHPYLGKFVIVRTWTAGVHFGILKEAEGTAVIIESAKRIWSWTGAFTLSEVSQVGIASAKISCAVPEIYLTQAIEIIPCSAKAEKCLSNAKEHQL